MNTAVLLSWFCVVLVVAGPAAAQAPRRSLAGRECLLCPNPLGNSDTSVTHRGRTIYLHAGACEAHWRDYTEEDRDKSSIRLQARGALFDETALHAAAAVNWGWLIFGVYVLFGLVFGALCAYLAVARGHGPIPWFFLGLFFNLLALIGIFTKAKGDIERLPAGIPAGLRKVPTTRAPSYCDGCGAENHPSAVKCGACGGVLRPSAAAKTTMV